MKDIYNIVVIDYKKKRINLKIVNSYFMNDNYFKN